MKPEFVVSVRFRQAGSATRYTRIAGLAKLPTDEEGHPYGQWSVVVDLWSRPDELGRALASLRFASPSAPAGDLRAGQLFELHAGPNLLGEVEVLVSPRQGQPPYDQDFLETRRTPARMHV
jgi:hypothetical protein